MKTGLLIPLIGIALSSCSFSGLFQHTCVFNQQVQTEEYFAGEANCEEGDSYYLSCKCGEHGEEKFYVSDPLGHVFDGGEFYTSDERPMVITLQSGYIALFYTCARCEKNGIRVDIIKANVEGHRHYAHEYVALVEHEHSGDCALCKESFTEDCSFVDGECHKCGNHE